ncbi:hypothetical protein GCM10009827_101530 [Dactylosporangium maewongense]|uniref:Methyltransferase n=2 Tax=Dactylosporangium maewongense TaxID=634393 RepID=A0ABN2CSL2_9ACTN
MHLPEPEKVVRALVAALKPAGMLVLSDWDCRRVDDMLVEPTAQVADAFAAFQAALIGIGEANGGSAAWAARAPEAMRAAGLVEIEGEVYNRLWRGGEPGCLLHASNSRQLEGALRARGVTTDQLAVLRDAMAHGDTLAWSYPMVTTQGRRPHNGA